MFSGFMVDAWAAATIVALVAGVVGFFAVLRGSAPDIDIVNALIDRCAQAGG